MVVLALCDYRVSEAWVLRVKEPLNGKNYNQDRIREFVRIASMIASVILAEVDN